MTQELGVLLKGDRNQNGQAMGRKGLQTRQRLIETTVAQLETTRLRDLRVSEIARQAGTSAATFYVYFPDVTDAVLAALEDLSQSEPELLALVSADWSQGDAEERARQIVRAYTDYWARNTGLFRVRNLAADEGDDRFRISREQAVHGMLNACADAVARAQAAGWAPPTLEPLATAGIVLAMLERFAAIKNTQTAVTPDRNDMVDAAAHVIAQLMGPPRAFREAQRD